MRNRRRSVRLVGLLAALVASQLLSATGVAAAPDVKTIPGLWVVKSSGETVLEAVQRQAAADPSYSSQARRSVDDWIARTNAGERVRLLDRNDTPIVATSRSLVALRSALALSVSQRPAGRPGHVAVPTTATVPPGGTRPLIDGNDPNAFPVKGMPGSGRSFWQNMPLTVTGTFCNPSCTVTDKYTSRVRITPGPTSAAVSSTNLYSPNSGNFGNEHFEMWGLCRGTICADTDTGQLPANSNDLLRYSDRHNNVITIAITLWVYFRPTAKYVPDGAKTTDCTFPATGSICRF